VFWNLERSIRESALHAEFLQAISCAEEDPSNKLLDVETQLAWLREIAFVDVDRHWKWRELALLAGISDPSRNLHRPGENLERRFAASHQTMRPAQHSAR
jgi:hypothetical protein